MSESNIEKIIVDIFSNERNLIKFLACENQYELYKYCLKKMYIEEEFDKFTKTNKETNFLGFSREIFLNKTNEEAKTFCYSFYEKVRQTFIKILAAGLAVFSVAPIAKNLIPNTVQIVHTDIKKTKYKTVSLGAAAFFGVRFLYDNFLKKN